MAFHPIADNALSLWLNLSKNQSAAKKNGKRHTVNKYADPKMSINSSQDWKSQPFLTHINCTDLTSILQFQIHTGRHFCVRIGIEYVEKLLSRQCWNLSIYATVALLQASNKSVLVKKFVPIFLDLCTFIIFLGEKFYFRNSSEEIFLCHSALMYELSLNAMLRAALIYLGTNRRRIYFMSYVRWLQCGWKLWKLYINFRVETKYTQFAALCGARLCAANSQKPIAIIEVQRLHIVASKSYNTKLI